MKEDKLADFLNRHEHPIRNLKLGSMLLLKDFDEPDNDPVEYWQGLYRRISHLNLASLNIDSLFRDPVDTRLGSSDVAQIRLSLDSGGSDANHSRGKTIEEYREYHTRV